MNPLKLNISTTKALKSWEPPTGHSPVPSLSLPEYLSEVDEKHEVLNPLGEWTSGKTPKDLIPSGNGPVVRPQNTAIPREQTKHLVIK